MVRPGRVAADIGCDHGKLAVWLVMKGLSPRVIAVDNRPMPLARARALATQTGSAPQVDCRLGDGLAPLAPCEAQEIILAGMSSETMAGILEKAPWVRDEAIHLVLLPATRPDFLRRWLCQNGFAILEEKPVEDRRRFYVAFSVAYTGAVTQPDALFCQVGSLPAIGGPAAMGCIRRRVEHLQKQLRAPLTNAERAAQQQLLDEVIACLK